MTLLVMLLCDVGIGTAVFPNLLCLDTEALQEKGQRVYQLRRANGMISVEWQKEENIGADGDWVEVHS